MDSEGSSQLEGVALSLTQCSYERFFLPAVATANKIQRALQSQATVSPASRAGTGPSASSRALLAPLVRGALSSAPAAGLESPVM